MRRPPMVAVVGRKNSGKTTLTVGLVKELVRRGHRVMTIKHGTHTFSIDPQTTDTWRHYNEGGAERVAMSSPDKFALVSRSDRDLGAEEIAAQHMSDADIVVCEGFKGSDLPKIEIFRRAANDAPVFGMGLAPDSTFLAIVTDDAEFRAPVPVLAVDDSQTISRLANIVEREVMRA